MVTTTPEFFHLAPTGPAKARLKEAEYYFLTGNLNEALAAAQQAWREHPDEPDVYRVLAYLHIARGEYQQAAQAAFQAVKIDGANPASFAIQAQVYLTFNMLKLADETLQIARRHFPENVALLALAADVAFRQGRKQDGVSLAQETLARSPHDGYAMALLGAYHLKTRQYPAAARMLEGAVMAYPQRWDYLRDYGIALLHIGETATAREALTRSFQLNPQDLPTKHHLLYAVKFDGNMAWYWRTSLFFYDHVTLAILLLVIGYGMTAVGGIWALVLALNWSMEAVLYIAEASVVFYIGLMLVLAAQSGAAMRGRKGKALDTFIRRALEPVRE